MRRSWLVLLVLLVPVAGAHSTAFETDPDPLTGLPEAPEYVQIRFTEPMDFDRSFIGIFDEDLLRRDAGDAHVDPDDPSVVQVYTGNLIKGIYTVSYETYSSVDGHQERGSLPLTIGVPCPSCLDGPQAPASLAEADIDADESAARILGYVAMAALLGTGVFARYALRTPRWGTATAVVAAGTFLVGSLWITHQIGQVAGPRLEALLQVRTWAGAAALLATWRYGPGSVPALLAAGIASVAMAGTGHGDRSATTWILQTFHVTTLLVWIGGLAPAAIIVARRDASRDVMRRFSQVATVGVGVLLLTGTLLSAQNLRGIDDLWGTAYGHLVVAKAALSLGILALGLRNHLHIRRPRFEGMRMRRDITAEAGLAVLLLVATGVLAGLSLPVDTPEPPPPHVQEAWWGDHFIRLEVSPARDDGTLSPGDHVQRVRILDRDGEPVAAHVRMGFTNRVLDIGAISAEAEATGDGWYETRGTQLGAVGEWEVEIRFTEAGSIIEREARFLLDLGVVGHVHGGVRISDPHFDSGYLDQGGRFERRFDESTLGSFEYHCHPHQWMQGSIEVNASAPAPADGVVQVDIYGDAGQEPAEMYFEPRDIRIPPGTVVRWVNHGSAPHTATNVQWYAP